MHAMYQLLQKVPTSKPLTVRPMRNPLGVGRTASACEWEETKRFYSGKNRWDYNLNS